jgi:hypothetical protein
MLALYQARGIRGVELNPVESMNGESARLRSLNQNTSDWRGGLAADDRDIKWCLTPRR